jgi:predicted pyridoxine 5'-phosphate oxidase superfamily flavin-nucleotide-binding protein
MIRQRNDPRSQQDGRPKIDDPKIDDPSEEDTVTMADARPPAAETAVQPDEVMFSPAVRSEQACRGSREAYARRAAAGRFARELSADVMAFIAQRDSAYLATASADGQPYVQHRGGPPGFLQILNDHTLAFLDYPGNKQFISIGHLAENERAFLFLMDYANARRLKLWGRAQVSNDPELIASLMSSAGSRRVEHAIAFTVLAWDWNCSQHIPRLVPAEPSS